MKNIIFLFFLFLSYISFSQCTTPASSFDMTVVDASCSGNGTITVTNVLPAAVGTDYFEYALFNNTTNNEVSVWTNSNIFNTLTAGSYTVKVRRRCDSQGVSAEFTKPITIASTESPISIDPPLILRNSKCNNGEVKITAFSTGTLEYALVSSLNVSESLPYVRPRQSSNRFSGLSAGTYYVRAYNQCNSFITLSFVIANEIAVSSVRETLSYFFYPIGCDSLHFEFQLFNVFKDTNDIAGDSTVKAWINWPNGTIDTIFINNGNSSLTPFNFYKTVRVPISKFDLSANSTYPWPSSLPNNSYIVHYGFRDACGIVYTKSFVYKKTTGVKIVEKPDESYILTTCDKIAYQFGIEHTGDAAATTPSVHVFANYSNAEFSLDGGNTWIKASNFNYYYSANNSFSGFVLLDRNTTYTVKFRYCGSIVYEKTFTTNGVAALNSYIDSRTEGCIGRGSFIVFKDNLKGSSTRFEMISAPTNQTIPAAFDLVNSSSSQYYAPPQFENLLPGNYEIKITDLSEPACPNRERIRTVNVNAFKADFTFNVDCNKNLIINRTNFPNMGDNSYRIEIFDHLNVLRFLENYSYNQLLYTITSTQLNSIPDGICTIRLTARTYGGNYDTCRTVDKIWIKNNSENLNLVKSTFSSGCLDNLGAISAIGSGGVAPYIINVFDNSNNLISPTITGTQLYSGLNTNNTYKITIQDACGSSNERFISSNSVAEIGIPGYSTMPCIGGAISLTLPNLPGVNYQWFKNGTLISGENLNTLSFPSLQHSDSALYTSMITIGQCEIPGGLMLDPNACGGPLAVDLTSFSAYCDPNGSVMLSWQTASEQNSLNFMINKSTDLVYWETIDVLAAKGNSSVMNSYASADRNPSAGITYYQLIERDLYGVETKYSPISNSCNNGGDAAFKVYPNPTNGEFKIEYFSEIKSDLELQIMDVNGRTITSQVHKLNPGSNTLYISEDFAKGIYIVYVKVKNKEMSPVKLFVR